MKSQALKIAFVRISSGDKSLAMIEALVLCNLKGHPFEVLTELSERGQLSVDLRASSFPDLLLASGARHECKRDLKRIPSILEESQHAISVEYVSASEFDARLFAQVASIADGAELVSAAMASRVKAWDAFLLSFDSMALMHALSVHLIASM